jgi:hypothetical protein
VADGRHVWALLLVSPGIRNLEVVSKQRTPAMSWRLGGNVRLVWMPSERVSSSRRGPMVDAQLVGIDATGGAVSKRQLVICPRSGEAFFSKCWPTTIDWDTPI